MFQQRQAHRDEMERRSLEQSAAAQSTSVSRVEVGSSVTGGALGTRCATVAPLVSAKLTAEGWYHCHLETASPHRLFEELSKGSASR